MAQEAKYERVKQILRKRIRASDGVGSKIPSTAQLHKTLGVSSQTVNRAIRDLVDEGILERQVGRGTFVARPRKATRNIGFVWPGHMDQLTKHPYMASILHAAEAASSADGRHLLVASNVDPIKPAFAEQSDQVAGVMILFNRDTRLVDAYLERGIPVVLIDPFVRSGDVPFVTSDQYAGMRDATLHLASLGHRRIAYVTYLGLDFLTFQERLLGYETAMREAHLEETSCVVRLPVAEQLLPEAVDVFTDVLDAVQPTACCCCHDDLAMWVIHVCHERGTRVPDDLSVVGFDDSGIASHVRPALTTVHVPLEGIGQRAVQILEGLIEEAQVGGQGTVLPTRLVACASTGPPSAVANGRDKVGRSSLVQRGGDDERMSTFRTVE